MPQKKYKSDEVAYWFFRINGCLNIVNFLVHNKQRGREGTDVDVLAVRFPYRQELAMSENPMKDHNCFISEDKIDLIISEVKRGLCDLNGPWTDPERQNMHRVLRAVGAFPKDTIDEISRCLYNEQYYENEIYRVRLFAVGERTNENLSSPVVQLTWNEILKFIYCRFKKYRSEKSQHKQWNHTGSMLFKQAQRLEVGAYIGTIMEGLI